jgi:hypothetical protein
MSAGFYCPQCERPSSLWIKAALELPGDSRSDEIAVQLVTCTECGFSGAALYEESRRGSLEAEVWDHVGCTLAQAAYLELSSLMLGCPNPGDAACLCEAHRALSLQDNSGRWVGLADYHPTGYFTMHYLQDQG